MFGRTPGDPLQSEGREGERRFLDSWVWPAGGVGDSVGRRTLTRSASTIGLVGAGFCGEVVRGARAEGSPIERRVSWALRTAKWWARSREAWDRYRDIAANFSGQARRFWGVASSPVEQEEDVEDDEAVEAREPEEEVVFSETEEGHSSSSEEVD